MPQKDFSPNFSPIQTQINPGSLFSSYTQSPENPPLDIVFWNMNFENNVFKIP